MDVTAIHHCDFSTLPAEDQAYLTHFCDAFIHLDATDEPTIYFVDYDARDPSPPMALADWKLAVRAKLPGASLFGDEDGFEALMADMSVGYWQDTEDWWIDARTHEQIMQQHWEDLNT